MDSFRARAEALLARTPLIDGHNDLPYVIWEANGGDVAAWNPTRLHAETDTDIPRLKVGMVGTQVFTAFLPTHTPDPLQTRLRIIDVMMQLQELNNDTFYPVLAPDDVQRARQLRRIGIIRAVEGLTGVSELAPIRAFHAMGVRIITLCHNENLPFIDSATDAPGPEPLSAFGEEIVAEMERIGLIIDLAHASAAAQHRVMDVTRGPVLISHANARALCPHPRNAPDDVIRRVAEGGGVVMATFVPGFLAPEVYARFRPVMDAHGKALPASSREDYERARLHAFAAFERDGIDWLIDHLEHMRNLAGIEALGIGSDFYGGANPPGLDDAACFPALFARMLRRGWHESELEKIAHDNIMRLWRTVHGG